MAPSRGAPFASAVRSPRWCVASLLAHVLLASTPGADAQLAGCSTDNGFIVNYGCFTLATPANSTYVWKGTWAQSDARCRALNGTLGAPTNDVEMQALRWFMGNWSAGALPFPAAVNNNVTRTPVWVGLKAACSSCYTGYASSCSGCWLTGEPNSGISQSCAQLNWRTGVWYFYDENCGGGYDLPYPALCRYQLPVPTPSASATASATASSSASRTSSASPSTSAASTSSASATASAASVSPTSSASASSSSSTSALATRSSVPTYIPPTIAPERVGCSASNGFVVGSACFTLAQPANTSYVWQGTWTQSDTKCKSLNGTLAAISSDAEMQALRWFMAPSNWSAYGFPAAMQTNVTRTAVWVGIRAACGTCYTGYPGTCSNCWIAGEPNSGVQQSCSQLNYRNSMWGFYDETCGGGYDLPYPALCRYTVPAPTASASATASATGTASASATTSASSSSSADPTSSSTASASGGAGSASPTGSSSASASATVSAAPTASSVPTMVPEAHGCSSANGFIINGACFTLAQPANTTYVWRGTWAQSEARCQALNGTLAPVTSDAEMQALRWYMGNFSTYGLPSGLQDLTAVPAVVTPVWLGLRASCANCFINYPGTCSNCWIPGEPNTPNALSACVQINNRGGVWGLYDEQCGGGYDLPYPALCKYWLVSPSPTPTASASASAVSSATSSSTGSASASSVTSATATQTGGASPSSTGSATGSASASSSPSASSTASSTVSSTATASGSASASAVSTATFFTFEIPTQSASASASSSATSSASSTASPTASAKLYFNCNNNATGAVVSIDGSGGAGGGGGGEGSNQACMALTLPPDWRGTWADTQAQCAAMGGFATLLSTADEYAAALRLMTAPNAISGNASVGVIEAWTGVKGSIASVGVFEGLASNASYWIPGEPNNGPSCVMLTWVSSNGPAHVGQTLADPNGNPNGRWGLYDELCGGGPDNSYTKRGLCQFGARNASAIPTPVVGTSSASASATASASASGPTASATMSSSTSATGTASSTATATTSSSSTGSVSAPPPPTGSATSSATASSTASSTETASASTSAVPTGTSSASSSSYPTASSAASSTPTASATSGFDGGSGGGSGSPGATATAAPTDGGGAAGSASGSPSPGSSGGATGTAQASGTTGAGGGGGGGGDNLGANRQDGSGTPDTTGATAGGAVAAVVVLCGAAVAWSYHRRGVKNAGLVGRKGRMGGKGGKAGKDWATGQGISIRSMGAPGAYGSGGYGYGGDRAGSMRSLSKRWLPLPGSSGPVSSAPEMPTIMPLGHLGDLGYGQVHGRQQHPPMMHQGHGHGLGGMAGGKHGASMRNLMPSLPSMSSMGLGGGMSSMGMGMGMGGGGGHVATFGPTPVALPALDGDDGIVGMSTANPAFAFASKTSSRAAAASAHTSGLAATAAGMGKSGRVKAGGPLSTQAPATGAGGGAGAAEEAARPNRRVRFSFSGGAAPITGGDPAGPNHGGGEGLEDEDWEDGRAGFSGANVMQARRGAPTAAATAAAAGRAAALSGDGWEDEDDAPVAMAAAPARASARAGGSGKAGSPLLQPASSSKQAKTPPSSPGRGKDKVQAQDARAVKAAVSLQRVYKGWRVRRVLAGWRRFSDESDVWFFNTRTGVTAWTLPEVPFMAYRHQHGDKGAEPAAAAAASVGAQGMAGRGQAQTGASTTSTNSRLAGTTARTGAASTATSFRQQGGAASASASAVPANGAGVDERGTFVIFAGRKYYRDGPGGALLAEGWVRCDEGSDVWYVDAQGHSSWEPVFARIGAVAMMGLGLGPGGAAAGQGMGR